MTKPSITPIRRFAVHVLPLGEGLDSGTWRTILYCGRFVLVSRAGKLYVVANGASYLTGSVLLLV